MWKYEQEFRIDKPETVGEKDKHFDLDNYKDWLEEQLTDCRKQLSIQRVSNCGGAIPYDSLSDSFKKSIDSIEDNLNR